MKICFIGSNGFLAQAFGRYFASQNDYLISCIGKTKPTYNHFKFSFVNLVHDKVSVITLIDFDIIFYLAGEGVQINNTQSVFDIYAVNSFIPVELIFSLHNCGFGGTFVTFGSYAEIGSNTVFEKFSETKLLESRNPAPNDYVISKRLLSNFINNYNVNFNLLHFILPTIYGKNESKNRLIPYILSCKEQNQNIYLTAGNQIRQFIHVDEIPIIINKAIKLGLSSGIYNIGGEVLRIRDLVLEIAHKWNISTDTIIFNSLSRWDVSMEVLILDSSKIENLLGFKIEGAVLDMLDTYKD